MNVKVYIVDHLRFAR